MAKLTKAVAWLHTLHMEGGQKSRRLTFSRKNAFGEPGKDYSAEYRVTTEALVKRRAALQDGQAE